MYRAAPECIAATERVRRGQLNVTPGQLRGVSVEAENPPQIVRDCPLWRPESLVSLTDFPTKMFSGRTFLLCTPGTFK
jgi:hypothetical protein